MTDFHLESARGDIAELKQEMLAMELRLTKHIQEAVSTAVGPLRDAVQAVDKRIDEKHADLLKWSFVFWVGAVAAIAALAGVLRA